MTLLEKAWYQKNWYNPLVLLLLWPVALLFWLVSTFRRRLYQSGVLASEKPSVPIIVVGNISVGGNGKTPVVIRLAQALKQLGYRPGVLSRGYGGKSKNYPLSVDEKSDSSVIGDEPALMKQHIDCPLVVDPNRPRGARHLVDFHKCNLIICDDGLQHYALQRDVEIVVVDGIRRFGNGLLLPIGPLREGRWRLSTVDFVINNGGEAQNGEHLMSLEPGRLVNVKYPNQSKSINDLHGQVIAAAAIGNPQRFFNLLLSKQVKLKDCLSFSDHHQFTVNDLPKETVLMTEKDAVKCTDFAHEDWWYLPVSAKLTDDFKQQLLAKIKSVT